ncbi:MAG TPA: hypothetical protein VIV40_39675 [Kofleriaceae bacterium]
MRAACWIVVVAALHGCSNDNDVCIPGFSHPISLGLDEGETISFDITLAESSPCDARGQVELSQANPNAADLIATPDTFDLTHANPTQTIMLRALPDFDTMTEVFSMVLYIPGTIGNESPTMLVTVFDVDPP